MPPVEFCLGTSPSQAANSLPLRNVFGSATVAAIAVAMIGPIPGMVARRWLTGLFLCHARTCVSSSAIPLSDIFDLADDYLQHLAGNIRDTPVHLVHDNRNQSCHFVQTLRLD